MGEGHHRLAEPGDAVKTEVALPRPTGVKRSGGELNLLSDVFEHTDELAFVGSDTSSLALPVYECCGRGYIAKYKPMDTARFCFRKCSTSRAFKSTSPAS